MSQSPAVQHRTLPTSVGPSTPPLCNCALCHPVANLPCRKHCNRRPMKRLHTSLVFALSVPPVLSAATNPAAWQDGILAKVRTTVVENSCSTSTQSDAATYGNTARRTIDGSARCADIQGAVYTVRVGDTEYELTPDHSRVARASAYLPLSAAFLKQSSLANHMPGTKVKFRRDDDCFVVLVGKRESHYRIFISH
jgi:hypothetical protein